ncbi:MAG: class I SAM-dependent methyltransferase [Gemmatimonadaceae bacterium]
MKTPTTFQYSGTELEAVAGGKNYYRWIVDRFAPFFGRQVVEVGAGIGTFSEFVIDSPGVESLLSVEPAGNVFPTLERKFKSSDRVRTVRANIDEVVTATEADSIVAVNVLEHVEDDEAFLRAAAKIVRPDGHVLLFVPAHQFLFGSLDKAFDHYRRYSKAGLSSLLSRAGWEPIQISNVNIAGVLPWLVAGKILRNTTIGHRQMRLFDSLVIPVMRKIESIREPFIGQSLLAIARNRSR